MSDEEIELIKKIADLLQLEKLAAQFEKENGHYPSTKEWASLVDMSAIKFRQRLIKGRQAKEKIVQSNLDLVESLAKRYMNRGLSRQDLIQEGTICLIRAVEKFDHKKDDEFSTYATFAIQQALTKALADQSRSIQLPSHLFEEPSEVKKAIKHLRETLGKEPTDEEIAKEMEMSLEEFRFKVNSGRHPISLETLFSEHEEYKDLI